MIIKLTEAAAKEIIEQSPESSEDPIASIVWTLPNYNESYDRNKNDVSVSFKKITNGYWCLGYYERSEISLRFIKIDQGVEFMFEPVTATKPVSLVVIDFAYSEFLVSYDGSNA